MNTKHFHSVFVTGLGPSHTINYFSIVFYVCAFGFMVTAAPPLNGRFVLLQKYKLEPVDQGSHGRKLGCIRCKWHLDSITDERQIHLYWLCRLNLWYTQSQSSPAFTQRLHYFFFTSWHERCSLRSYMSKRRNIIEYNRSIDISILGWRNLDSGFLTF